jgi:hypothetical protein
MSGAASADTAPTAMHCPLLLKFGCNCTAPWQQLSPDQGGLFEPPRFAVIRRLIKLSDPSRLQHRALVRQLILKISD